MTPRPRGTRRWNAQARSLTSHARKPFLVMAGIGVAAFVLILVLFGRGGTSTPKNQKRDKVGKEGKEPVDTRALRRKAEENCAEGLQVVQRMEPYFTRSLTSEEKGTFLAELEKARRLFQEGMGGFEKINAATGEQFDLRRYQNALKIVRTKLLELK